MSPTSHDIRIRPEPWTDTQAAVEVNTPMGKKTIPADGAPYTTEDPVEAAWVADRAAQRVDIGNDRVYVETTYEAEQLDYAHEMTPQGSPPVVPLEAEIEAASAKTTTTKASS